MSGGSTAPSCCQCAKPVYKMEEVIALGKVWHKTCFTCGKGFTDGCNKTLRLDNYLDHDNAPYCTSCHTKLFKPKGYGNAGMSTYVPVVKNDITSNNTTTTTNTTNTTTNTTNTTNDISTNINTTSSNDNTNNTTEAVRRTSVNAKVDNLHKEQKYSGSNDEVDDSEW